MKLCALLLLACACLTAKTDVRVEGAFLTITTDIPNADHADLMFTCPDTAINIYTSVVLENQTTGKTPKVCSFDSVEVEIRNPRNEAYGYKSYLFSNGELAEIVFTHVSSNPIPSITAVWREVLEFFILDATPTLRKLEYTVLLRHKDGPIESLQGAIEVNEDGFRGATFVTPEDDNKPHEILVVSFHLPDGKKRARFWGHAFPCDPGNVCE